MSVFIKKKKEKYSNKSLKSILTGSQLEEEYENDLIMKSIENDFLKNHSN